jgi:hypothetical protein
MEKTHSKTFSTFQGNAIETQTFICYYSKLAFSVYEKDLISRSLMKGFISLNNTQLFEKSWETYKFYRYKY